MGDSVMLTGHIEGVQLTQLQQIAVEGGDVYHAMKKRDVGFEGFGEAYFSFVEPQAIKAWKQHTKMTLNLVVPIGSVRIVILDKREDSSTCGQFQEVTLSPDNYQRVTIPPMLWVGFHGTSETISVVLNVSSIEHSPDESNKIDIDAIQFDWINKS